VGNVILDIHIDNGRKLQIDALVVSHLLSNCLIAWKDMQKSGLILPRFPAKVHEIKMPNLNKSRDTLDWLVAEFADVFDDETLTPVVGEPMQIHLMRDNPNYKPTRISTFRKLPLHFKSRISLFMRAHGNEEFK
jgi:hypothetical protein